MAVAKITSKGQVTIPKDVRERLGLRAYRVRKRLSGSPFQKYRGYLKDLAGCDPDELVEQMRGQ
jgi:bifunctional DNA-binding transcriptional regulator/antitoxin component of YhaV-PrlF toxin-antitoxin module